MSLRRAIRDRMLSRPAVLVAHAVMLVVLSRLLTQAEFGLFALAAIAHQVAVSMADLGIKTQLLNSTTLDPRRHGEALGLAMTAAGLVGAAFLALVLLLPEHIAPASLDMALWIFAVSVFLAPLELLFNIPLMQSMRFGLISVVNVFGAWTRCGVAILAALYGAGPAALAAGILAEQIVSFLLFARARRAEPVPVPRRTGWPLLIADGLRLSSNQVVRHLSEFGILGAISGALGVATLGVYNRADQIVKLFDKVFLNSLSPVIQPAFVRAVEAKHAPAEIFLRKVELLSAVTWPAFALVALLADPLCRVVLGPGWDAAPVLVQLLALIGLSKPLTQMNQALFLALGELRLSTRLDVIHHLTRVTLAAAGALISIEAVCLMLALAYGIDVLLQTRAFARTTGFAPGRLMRVLGHSLLLTLATIAPAALVLQGLAAGPLGMLLAAGTAGLLGFGAGIVLLRHVIYAELRRALARLR